MACVCLNCPILHFDPASQVRFSSQSGPARSHPHRRRRWRNPDFPASAAYRIDPGRNVMLVKFLGLIAVISVATCLVPAGTHFFELANKMSMSQPEYMIVQKIYAGWSFFGIAVIAALLLTLIHTFMVRSDRTAFFLSLAAFLCLAATQGIFWMFTYPMNVASNNWTVTPADFEVARRQWEYSHAVNAVLTFAAFVAIAFSVLATIREVR